MKCREIMTGNPVCCLPDDSVGQAARLMRREHISSLPIVSDERSNTLIGILTNRDLVTKVLAESRQPNQTAVSDVMTRTIFACRVDDEVESAIAAMHEHGVRHLPIIDRRGRILGIISDSDTRVPTVPQRMRILTEVYRAA
jgi:CBS domain-containing protein